VTPAVRRKRAIKNADKWFSLYIRERDHHICQVCGKTSEQAPIQCGHLHTRGHYSTRWDPDNAMAQCAGCNMAHERDAGAFTMVFLRKYGQKGYDELFRKYSTPYKWRTIEIEELAEKFKGMLAELQEENK
jgi:uncharacterized protein YcaQ